MRNSDFNFTLTALNLTLPIQNQHNRHCRTILLGRIPQGFELTSRRSKDCNTPRPNATKTFGGISECTEKLWSQSGRSNSTMNARRREDKRERKKNVSERALLTAQQQLRLQSWTGHCAITGRLDVSVNIREAIRNVSISRSVMYPKLSMNSLRGRGAVILKIVFLILF